MRTTDSQTRRLLDRILTHDPNFGSAGYRRNLPPQPSMPELLERLQRGERHLPGPWKVG